MQDFLTFEKFITQDILIVSYYLGVLFLPIVFWIYRKKVTFIISKTKLSTLLYLFIAILFGELIWRMMFEAMIGYFDMHNYLQILVQQNLKR